MAIPDYQTLTRPVLRMAADGEWSSKDCIAALSDEFALSGEERAQMPPQFIAAVFERDNTGLLAQEAPPAPHRTHTLQSRLRRYADPLTHRRPVGTRKTTSRTIL